jgi:uncharacterized Zn-finger protein
MEEIDCNNEDEITCPYCGHKFSDRWEYQDDGEIDCESCEKTFNLTVNHSVDYTTSKLLCKGKHDYFFKSQLVQYSKTNYKTGIITVLPESEWRFIEINKCLKCDDCEYPEISREDWINKYPDVWNKYREWI